MIKTTPILALLAALAGASAQAAPADPDAVERRAAHREAFNRQLRDAEVELYCDHAEQALRLMREARQTFGNSVDSAVSKGRSEIDQVIWHVRHGDTGQAIAVLESARERLQRDEG